MEQDAEEIFDAIAGISRQVIADTYTDPKDISAIAFCGCLIGSVPVDRDGKPLCRAFSFLDYRGKAIHDREMKKPFTYQGIRIPALIRGLRVTLSAPASSKDFIWRIKWLEKYAPELQSRLCKWLNYKEYFILRATGRMVMTEDTAFSTFLFDSREGRKCFDKKLCKAYGIDPSIFPEVIRSTDILGPLTEKAAAEMGLCPGISVVAGGNDDRCRTNEKERLIICICHLKKIKWYFSKKLQPLSQLLRIAPVNKNCTCMSFSRSLIV